MIENLESTIASMVENLGVRLYDIETVQEYGRTIFRVTITATDGVSLDKCEEVSRMISPLLDVKDPVGGEYFFEVSSPGIERYLKKPSHFEQAVGEKAKIKCKDGTAFKGPILQASDGHVTIEDSDGPHTIPLSQIKTARTCFEWNG